MAAKSGADQVKEMVTARGRPGERGKNFGTACDLVLWEAGGQTQCGAGMEDPQHVPLWSMDFWTEGIPGSLGYKILIYYVSG